MLILACAWEQFDPNGWIKEGAGELAFKVGRLRGGCKHTLGISCRERSRAKNNICCWITKQLLIYIIRMHSWLLLLLMLLLCLVRKYLGETSPRSQHMVCLERRYPTLQANVSQETISLAFKWLHELGTTNYCMLALMLHACSP